MIVTEVSTGKTFQVEIIPVESGDYSRITKSRYFFNWKEELDHEVYKLQIIGSNDILGLVSIEVIPEEWRVHIRLLTVSKENKGKEKRFENIIGDLLTFIGKMAIREFAHLACVSLRPKTNIAQHYIDKYDMNKTGITLSLEVEQILNLVSKYDHD